MSKFTEGKWEINSELDYSINSGNKHIAMVNCAVRKAEDKEENEANVRLIVKAPEMYQSLREAFIQFEMTGRDLEGIVTGRIEKLLKEIDAE